LDRVDAAVRLHDVERSVEAAAARRAREPAQIPLGDRLDVGREDGGARPLVLAPLARDLVRGDRERRWPELADPLEHRALVLGVRVGVEQADSDRLDACGAEVVDDLGQPVELERRALHALRAEASRYLAPE